MSKPYYEYAIVFHTKGQAGSDVPRSLESWGRDAKGCLEAYRELLAKAIFVDIGIKRRQVSGWSDIDVNQLQEGVSK